MQCGAGGGGFTKKIHKKKGGGGIKGVVYKIIEFLERH